jgi:hypothetical protein
MYFEGIILATFFFFLKILSLHLASKHENAGLASFPLRLHINQAPCQRLTEFHIFS